MPIKRLKELFDEAILEELGYNPRTGDMQSEDGSPTNMTTSEKVTEIDVVKNLHDAVRSLPGGN